MKLALVLNLALAALLMAAAFLMPRFAARLLLPLERGIARLARRPAWAYGGVGALSLVCSLIITVMRGGIPAPSVHDEFSYLLAADTYAHGRLTNPTHLQWVHFETVHVIHQPTYMSKYPPGQGMILAAGQVFAGQPIVGVWVCTALACIAVCWMLRSWVPPRWALFGGALAALHGGVQLWAGNYFGGSLAMAGGALALGAGRRLMTREVAPKLSVLVAVGCSILLLTRPYEGGVFTLILLVWVAVQRLHARLRFVTMLAPMLPVFALTLGFWGYYNLRITGNPLRMPYMIHESTYASVPLFLFQPLRPKPEYRHASIEQFQSDYAVGVYVPQRSVEGYISSLIERGVSLSRWLFKPLTILLFLLALPLAFARYGYLKPVGIVLLCYAVAFLPLTFFNPHYAAPAMGLVFLLLVASCRALSVWRWRGRPTGRVLAYGGLALTGVFLLLSPPGAKIEPNYRRIVKNQLERMGGKHLVLVRYSPNHIAHYEWVYNAADIDASPVVWAHEMGAPEDEALLHYFADRKVWVVEPDFFPPRLRPYAEAKRED